VPNLTAVHNFDNVLFRFRKYRLLPISAGKWHALELHTIRENGLSFRQHPKSKCCRERCQGNTKSWESWSCCSRAKNLCLRICPKSAKVIAENQIRSFKREFASSIPEWAGWQSYIGQFIYISCPLSG
jgi:hypothetical protein